VAESPRQDDFDELVRRVFSGSEDAAGELVCRYQETVRRVVRCALSRRLRPQFDSLDFVQQVWGSFFRLRWSPADFDRPQKLVAFLIKIARNKVAEEANRRLKSKNYGMGQECSLGELGDRVWEQLRDPSQQPFGTVMAQEQWDHVLRGQPKQCRKIVRLRLQGRSYAEIAAILQISERTVGRHIQKLLRGMQKATEICR